MQQPAWFLERTSGIRTVGAGPQGWEQLGLDHQDVTDCNRVRLLGFSDNRGRQTVLKLEPSETLHLVVRHQLGLGIDAAPPMLILGIKREDGSGTYALIQPDGNISLSSALNP